MKKILSVFFFMLTFFCFKPLGYASDLLNGYPGSVIGPGSATLNGVISGTGWVYFQAETSSFNVPSGTTVLVQSMATDIDNHVFFSNASGTYTPKIPGTYCFSAFVKFPGGPTSDGGSINITKNGINGQIMRDFDVFTPLNSLTVDGVMPLVCAYANGSTDYFNLLVFQNSGSTVAIGAMFSGFRAGP